MSWTRRCAFTTVFDQRAMPGMFLVAQIDGRSFTRLTREVHQFDAPFDERFHDLMVATTNYIMQCGFQVIYG